MWQLPNGKKQYLIVETEDEYGVVLGIRWATHNDPVDPKGWDETLRMFNSKEELIEFLANEFGVHITMQEEE
jgi:hypothetical protein